MRAERERLQRRTLAVIVLSQLFSGAGLAAGIAVGALLAEDMLGTDALAGMPVALFTLGSAGAAMAVGAISQRRGRRVGLVSGFLAGGVGAAGVVAAATLGNVWLLFAALLVYGAGTSTHLQARYAGADLAAPSSRGTAVSIVMVSTTLGAVAGPNLAAPMGRLAESIAVPALAGPFILAAVAYTLAGLVLFALLRPDPLLVALREGLPSTGAPEQPMAPIAAAGARAGAGVIVGATVMVLTQIAMVAIMTTTPVHMTGHGHGLGAVGFVIGAHIAFMFLPSPLTGLLVDRIGRVPMASVAAVILMGAGLVGALAPGESLPWLVVALGLLGLGWNAGLISGTALVVDAAPLANRARIQGRVDLLIALAGAGGGAASGAVVAGAGFATLSLVGGGLSLVLVPVLLWYRRPGRVAPAPA